MTLKKVDINSKPVTTYIYHIELSLKVIVTVESTSIASAEIEALNGDYQVIDNDAMPNHSLVLLDVELGAINA